MQRRLLIKELHGFIDVFVNVVVVKYKDGLYEGQRLRYESIWKRLFWPNTQAVGFVRSTRAYLVLQTVKLPDIFGLETPPVKEVGLSCTLVDTCLSTDERLEASQADNRVQDKL